MGMAIQTVFETLLVRPVHGREELEQGHPTDALHQLGVGHLVRESVERLATIGEEPVALLDGRDAACKCSRREKWICW